MNTEQIIHNLKEKLVIFPSSKVARDWIDQNFKNIEILNQEGLDKIIQEGNKYILNKISEVVKKTMEEIQITRIIKDLKVDFINIQTKSELSKNSLYGAGIGVGAALMFSGPVGWLALAGAAIGAYYNLNRKKDEISYYLFSNSKKAANETIKKLEPLIRKTIILKDHNGFSLLERNVSLIHSLSQEQLKLKKFLESRNIKYLLHFTDNSNIKSIENHGLLSIKELTKRNIIFKQNDLERIDGMIDYISLSITNPNNFIYRHYKRSGRVKNTSVVFIDASILYMEMQQSRYYCDRNAAASTCQKGNTLDDFYNLFKEEMNYKTTSNAFTYNRKLDFRNDNETTDPQAEILFSNYIDKKYIIQIKEM